MIKRIMRQWGFFMKGIGIAFFSIGIAILLMANMGNCLDAEGIVKVNDDTTDRPQNIGPEKTSMIIRGDNIYSVWQDSRDYSDEVEEFQKCDIYFSKGVLDDDRNASFSTNVRVNDVPGGPFRDMDSRPDMAVGDDGTIHVVWTDSRNVNDQLDGNDIYYSRSIDGGSTFQSDKLIGCESGFSRDADISVSGEYVYIVYGYGSDPTNNVVNMVISDDKGENFGDIQNIFVPSNSATGGEDMVLEAQGSNVYLAFRDRTSDFLGDIVFMKSTDNGGTFSNPVVINDDGDNKAQDFVSLAVSGDHVYLVWDDDRTSAPVGIYLAASHDGGDTFGSNMIIAEYLGFPHPSVSAKGSDVVITYKRGHEDVYGVSLLANISHDNGTTWSKEVFITDTDVNRPDVGPSVVSVVEDGFGVFFEDDRNGQESGDDVYFRFLKFEDPIVDNSDDDTTDDTTSDDDDDSGSSTKDDSPGFGLIPIICIIGLVLFAFQRKRS